MTYRFYVAKVVGGLIRQSFPVGTRRLYRIAAHPDIVALSPEQDDLPSVNNWLDEPHSFAGTDAVTETWVRFPGCGRCVAVVEVSTDNGASWHRANGFENWTYSWTPIAGRKLQSSRAR